MAKNPISRFRKLANNTKIILASQSPRRHKLLKKITDKFVIKPSNFNEATIQEKNPIKFAKIAAESKAECIARQIKKDKAIIIAADTIVVFPARGGSVLGRNSKIIGKPKNDKEAFEILSELSGQEQAVITGFCLINTETNKKIIGQEKSIVKMKRLSNQEIKKYISTGEGRDKAGAYAVQGRADKFIEYIKGDYYNVVGLPINKIKKALQKIK